MTDEITQRNRIAVLGDVGFGKEKAEVETIERILALFTSKMARAATDIVVLTGTRTGDVAEAWARGKKFSVAKFLESDGYEARLVSFSTHMITFGTSDSLDALIQQARAASVAVIALTDSGAPRAT